MDNWAPKYTWTDHNVPLYYHTSPIHCNTAMNLHICHCRSERRHKIPLYLVKDSKVRNDRNQRRSVPHYYRTIPIDCNTRMYLHRYQSPGHRSRRVVMMMTVLVWLPTPMQRRNQHSVTSWFDEINYHEINYHLLCFSLY